MECAPGQAAVCQGDPANLQHAFIALFCSVRAPGDVVLQLLDVARALREAGVPVIGGFHSPMERECLIILLRGTQQVVVCPARSVKGMRVPAAWRGAMREGRLSLMSPFAASQRRATNALAEERNRYVVQQAAVVLIAHAAPGGRMEALALEVTAVGKPLLTLKSPANAHLVDMGARPISEEDVRRGALSDFL